MVSEAGSCCAMVIQLWRSIFGAGAGAGACEGAGAGAGASAVQSVHCTVCSVLPATGEDSAVEIE